MKLEQTNFDIDGYGEKYHFYCDNGGTIVCATTYKKQMIRGVAKCNPDDEFSVDIGKKLAYLRCRHKFAKKKAMRARRAYKEAAIAKAAMDNKFGKATDFVNDSDYQLLVAADALLRFEQELNERR